MLADAVDHLARTKTYFRGEVNVARVRAWRSLHPGYWRKGHVRVLRYKMAQWRNPLMQQ
jgi:hypothetical protein